MDKQKRRFEGRIEPGVCTPQIAYQPYILCLRIAGKLGCQWLANLVDEIIGAK